jgi:hypothetical protein
MEKGEIVRMFEAGRPFMDIKPESMDHSVYEVAYGEEAQKGGWAEPGDGECPIFSERFLYPLIGKDDARFVLAVATEYDYLIRKYGTAKMREMLDR